MNRKETMALVARFASCVESAAQNTSNTSRYSDLESVIREQERDHRAFGRRLVGASRASAGRFSVPKAVSYFVARTVADALVYMPSHGFGSSANPEDRPASTFVGVRMDYILAAVLVAEAAFRDALHAEIARAFPGCSVAGVCARVLEADYAALVAGAS